jgi:DNA gyrase subunit A
VLAVPAFEEGYNILMATRQGLVKKTDIMAYSRPGQGGIIALGLTEGDELIAARITDGSYNVFLWARPRASRSGSTNPTSGPPAGDPEG